MRRVKVLQVITGLGPGGAERLVLDIMRLIDRDRFDLRLASIVDDLRALEVYGHQGMTVEVFELRHSPLLFELGQMRRLVKDFAPDIIHAHMFHSLLATIAASKFIAPSPAICFTSHLNAYPPARSLAVRALKKWRHADIIFATDQHPDLNSEFSEVIPNGVHVGLLPPMRSLWDPRRHVRLLAVGRLAQQKDPIGLLKSVARANLPGMYLEFVGVGPLERDLRALASKLGLADRIVFHGLRTDVRELMRSADIFVMHSEYEGMPMALLEAGAEAMPVLATPVGSIPAVLGENRGWMAQPDLFAQALRYVVSDPLAAITAGRHLHSHVLRNHSINMAVRKHEQLYTRVYQSTH
jgi:glycosyltransferase involved in cell wall biosynthesis